MSTAIRVLTVALFLLPLILLALALEQRPLALPAALVLAIHAWIWLRFRPTRFIVSREAIEVVWPLKRRRLPRDGITRVCLVDARALRAEVGWAVRVGAGGAWGAFGWLWTRRRGVVQMYVSRTDRFVWIERGGDRPWVITPERAEEFVRDLEGG